MGPGAYCPSPLSPCSALKGRSWLWLAWAQGLHIAPSPCALMLRAYTDRHRLHALQYLAVVVSSHGAYTFVTSPFHLALFKIQKSHI